MCIGRKTRVRQLRIKQKRNNPSCFARPRENTDGWTNGEDNIGFNSNNNKSTTTNGSHHRNTTKRRKTIKIHP